MDKCLYHFFLHLNLHKEFQADSNLKIQIPNSYFIDEFKMKNGAWMSSYQARKQEDLKFQKDWTNLQKGKKLWCVWKLDWASIAVVVRAIFKNWKSNLDFQESRWSRLHVWKYLILPRKQ